MGEWMTVLQVVGGPIVALVAKSTIDVSRGRRTRHRIRDNAELLALLPEDHGAPLSALVADQVAKYSADQRRQLRRKISASTVAALILVGLVGGGALAAGLAVGRWWSIVPASLVALLMALLVVAGVGQLFEYPDEEATRPGP